MTGSRSAEDRLNREETSAKTYVKQWICIVNNGVARKTGRSMTAGFFV